MRNKQKLNPYESYQVNLRLRIRFMFVSRGDFVPQSPL